MTREHISGLILGVGLVFALGLHYFDQGKAEPDNQAAETKLIRTQMVQFYLALEELETPERERMKAALEKRWPKVSANKELGESATLLFWLIGEDVLARKLIATCSDDGDLLPLRYSMNLIHELPDDWEQTLSDDWTGARIAALAHKRMGNESELAAALIRLRHYENLHARNRNVENWMGMLNLIGMGLLISMWFSARQWARLGENFFKLSPIRLPLATTFRFVGLFLLGLIFVGLIFDQVIPSENRFLKHMLSYPLQIGVGLVLLRFFVFKKSGTMALVELGLINIKMRFVNLFQIFGGLAILIFLIDVGQLLALALHWPADHTDFGAYISQIFESPIRGACYLFMACVIGPLFEEIIFRGMIFRGLMSKLRPSSAMYLSSFFFCIIHPLPHWPQIFLVGVGLALVYHRTANIMVNIWAHAVFNLISILLALTSFY